MPITDALNPAAAVGGAILGGVQLFSNLQKEKKAKQELSKLVDPFYKIQDEYYENKNLAGNLAQTGLPTASKDYYTEELQRGLGSGISGTLNAGGNPNDIAKLFSIYDKGIDRTAAADAEQRIKNINYYMATNKDLAGQKNIQFGFNEVRPYERKYKEFTQQKYAAENNAYNGANMILGSMGALGTSLGNNNLLEKLFKEEQIPTGVTGGDGRGFNAAGYATGVF